MANRLRSPIACTLMVVVLMTIERQAAAQSCSSKLKTSQIKSGSVQAHGVNLGSWLVVSHFFHALAGVHLEVLRSRQLNLPGDPPKSLQSRAPMLNILAVLLSFQTQTTNDCIACLQSSLAHFLI